MFISAALERDHQFRRLGEFAPAPGVEFSIPMAVQVDFALLAWREVVVDPFFGAAEQAGRADAGLLVKFAPGGVQKVLAVVDAALGELPVVRGRGPGAAAVPDAAVGVKEDDADIGTMERKVRQGTYLRAMTAEAGAS